MSLVFLKSKDKQASDTIGAHNPNKPYRFSNYLTQPIRIPPNAQVCYVSSQFKAPTDGDLPNDVSFFNTNALENWSPLTSHDPFCMPLYMLFSNSQESQLKETHQQMNDYALSSNEFSMDSDYVGTKYATAILKSLIQTYPVSATSLNFAGASLIFDPSINKPEFRIDTILPVDNYNLYFNCVATNPLYNFTSSGGGNYLDIGINWLGVTYVDLKFQKDIQMRSVNSPSGNTNFIGGNCYGLLPGGITDSTNARPRVLAGGANFYNTGFSSTGIDGNGGFYDWISSSPDTPIMPFNAGRYAMTCSSVGIKKIVGDTTPSVDPQQSNSGGHQFPGHLSSGGYALWTQTNADQSVADQHYDVGSSVKTGFTGLCPQFVGVMSQPFMRQIGYEEAIKAGLSNTSARDLTNQFFYYNGVNDLNKGATATEARGARPRYFFGIDILDNGQTGGAGDLLVQAKVLDCINGSVENSQYVNVGNALSIASLSNGINTATPAPYVFDPTADYSINVYNTALGRRSAMIFFRFRWINKTQMNIEFTLSVEGFRDTYNNATDEPYAPSADFDIPITADMGDPRNKWCLLASMDTNKHDITSQIQYHFPSYMGDACLAMYPVASNANELATDWPRQCTKGWYMPRESNRFFRDNNNGGGRQPAPFTNQNLFYKKEGLGVLRYDPANPTDDTATSTTLINSFYNGEKTIFTPAGVMEIYPTYLGVPMTSPFKAQFYLNMAGSRAFIPDGTNPDTEMGYVLGFNNPNNLSDDVINVNDGTTLTAYRKEAEFDLSVPENQLTLHVQLPNLPIISQNGVVSSVNKTIYVVDTLCIDHVVPGDATSGTSLYCDKAPYPIWIDINNLETIELNKIDVLITKDDNTPHIDLSGDFQLVVQFRDKTSGTIINSIPVNTSSITRTY